MKAKTYKITPVASEDLETSENSDKVDILCFSTQDWYDLWTRKQRFMTRFAREGHRTIYVETQFHWITYFLRFKTHWRRIFTFLKGPRKVENNLWIYTPPILLPFFQMSETICKINAVILEFVLKRELKKLSFDSPVVYSYAPFMMSLIKKLKPSKVVYECVDEYSAAKGLISAKVVKQMELETLARADVTIVTAPSLFANKNQLSNNIHLIPNAADIARFNPVADGSVAPHSDYDDIPEPRIGFLGAVACWIDLELIAFLAKKRPEYSFVLVGPVGVDVSRLKRISNIHWMGRYPFDELPKLLAGFTVCINPYILDEVATGCSPLKLYEYLASGKPIVSVRMPEAEKFSDFVMIGDSYTEFLSLVDHAVSGDEIWRKELAMKQKAESIKHDWDSRFEQTKNALKSILTK